MNPFALMDQLKIKSHKEFIQYLINHNGININVNEKFYSFYTISWFATKYNLIDKLPSCYYADPLIRDDEGKTIAMYSAELKILNKLP